MGMEFQAKQATAAQADILGRIHAASWQAAYEGVVPEAERRRFTPERRAKIWSDFCRAAHRNAICFFAMNSLTTLLCWRIAMKRGRQRTKERSTLFICIPAYGVRLLQNGPFYFVCRD